MVGASAKKKKTQGAKPRICFIRSYIRSELKITLLVEKLNCCGVSFLFSFSLDFLSKLNASFFSPPEFPDFALSSLSLPHTNAKSVSILL